MWLRAFTPIVPGPPGWLPAALRTWLAMISALGAAFWLQLPSASSAAVCVAILATPSRGQALSKSIYRMIGTIAGAMVSVLLAALFPQDRVLFLTGCGLWLMGCVVVGSLRRDFRAYGAVLSGYTVDIVAIADIDSPGNIFDGAVNRVAVITLGIVASVFFNQILPAPEIWRRLLRGLEEQAQRVRRIADDALHGEHVPDPVECAEIAATILGFSSLISFAHTELEDGNRRMAGARSAMIALLDQLTAARGVARILGLGLTSEDVLTAARSIHAETGEEESAPGVRDEAARASHDLMALAQGPDPSIADVFVIERVRTMTTNRSLAANGIAALRGERAPVRDASLTRHGDGITALMNALRVGIAFALCAGACIASGQSSTSLMLINIAAMCALGISAPDSAAFGRGVLLGAVPAVACGLLINYVLLVQAAAFPILAVSLLPLVLLAGFLSARPSTSGAGFIILVWGLIQTGLDNQQGFDLSSSLNEGLQLVGSAILLFLSNCYILPPSPRRRLLRIATSLSAEIRQLLRSSPADLGYDRLAAAATTSRLADRLAQAQQQMHLRRTYETGKDTPGYRSPVMARLTTLSDLCGSLTRARRTLREAEGVTSLGAAARAAGAVLTRAGQEADPAALRDAARHILAASAEAPERERWIAVRACSGLASVAWLIEEQAQALRRLHILAPAEA